MDFSKLSNGAKMALIGGTVLVINLFLPWFTFAGFDGNAFEFPVAWIGSFVVIAGAGVLLLKAFGTRDVEAGKFKPEQLATILAGAGTVLILIKLLVGESEGPFTADRGIGLFVGVAAAGVVTFGSFTSMKDAGLDLPGMDKIGGGDN